MPRIFGSASTGGGGTPGGSTTQVQFNNAGAFGGVTGATTNGTFLTLVTPVLGVATGTSLTLGGATLSTNALAVAGTGQITGKVYVGSAAPTSSNYALWKDGSNRLWVNADATNGTVSVGVADDYGVTYTGPAYAGGRGWRLNSDVTFGWSATNPLAALDTGLSRISAGVIGVGTGAQGSVAGGLQAATLALGGATIGSNALAVTGSAVFNAKVVLGGNTLAVQSSTGKALLYIDGVFGWTASGSADASTDTGLSRISAGVIGVGTGAQGSVAGRLDLATMNVAGGAFGGDGNWWSGNNLNIRGTTQLSFGAADVILTRGGVATLQHGNFDAASPVAQTIKFQDVVAGTTNTAGVNATIQAPAGTGTGAGGSLIFQVAAAGSTGTAKNAWATALTIDSTRAATFEAGITASGQGFVVKATTGTTILWNLGVYGFTGSGTANQSAVSDTGISRISAGVIGVGTGAQGNTTGTLTATYLRTVGVTVSALPAASAGNQGQRGFVTDATATTYLSTVAGGGANKVPVVSDGTNWIIG